MKDIKAAKKIAVIDKNQEKILRKYWPGKLTAVLKRTRLRRGYGRQRKKIKLYGADSETIALRIPAYKFVNLLLQKTNKPLTGTSANISGFPGSVKFKEVIGQFRNKKHQPDLFIDAGNLPKGIPSTIIDLVGPKIRILRQGDVKINF